MWWNRKDKIKEPEIVACDECKHLVYLMTAQVVQGGFYGRRRPHHWKMYYCPEHKKNYDRFYHGRNGEIRYYRYEVMVNEKGELLA